MMYVQTVYKTRTVRTIHTGDAMHCVSTEPHYNKQNN